MYGMHLPKVSYFSRIESKVACFSLIHHTYYEYDATLVYMMVPMSGRYASNYRHYLRTVYKNFIPDTYENMNMRRDKSTKCYREKFVGKMKLQLSFLPYCELAHFYFFVDCFCFQCLFRCKVCRFSLLDGSVFAPFESGKICVSRNMRKYIYEKHIDQCRSM